MSIAGSKGQPKFVGLTIQSQLTGYSCAGRISTSGTLTFFFLNIFIRNSYPPSTLSYAFSEAKLIKILFTLSFI